MYLYVFTFLLVVVMGLYTELFALQSARLFRANTSIAQAMHVWHASMYNASMADFTSSTPKISSSMTTGCFVTSQTKSPNCGLNWADISTWLPEGYVVNDGTATRPPMPPWSSLLFDVGTRRLLFTFVRPTESIYGFRATEVYRQMMAFARPAGTYGYVKANSTCNGTVSNWIITPGYYGTIQVCYDLGSTLSLGVAGLNIPDGTAGYISIIR